MNVIQTALPEVLLLEPKVFGDERGFFMESFNQKVFDAAVGHHIDFVQDNQSRSTKGVLRGLHYQLPPNPQGKLVRAVAGAVFDVAVDMRRSSQNFGKWVGYELSAENKRMLWIPPGFAHGFLVVSASADFLYKTTDFYAPQAEGAVRFNDEAIGIQWPDVGVPLQLSGKDKDAPLMRDAVAFK